MLILMLLSSLQVANTARTERKKTEGVVWIKVSWEGFGIVLAFSFAGLGHVGICYGVVGTKLQLHRVCTYAGNVLKSQTSNLQ